MTTYTPYERVQLARKPNRPHIRDFISALFENFFEQRGDRLFGDDPAILCGIAMFEGTPVTVAGHVKGTNLTGNLACNYGMPQPEGYRKFQRIIAQAEKFNRPIITFIDTPGAYPGIEAEERGQGEAIAKCLSLLSGCAVPVIAVVTGEGGSGGALAMSVADKIIMLENSVYSVLSPEGFASILWKDAGRMREACDVMKLTAHELLELGIADEIIPEPDGGASENPGDIYDKIRVILRESLAELRALDKNALLNNRYEKFRKVR